MTRKTNVKEHTRKTKKGRTDVKRHARSVVSKVNTPENRHKARLKANELKLKALKEGNALADKYIEEKGLDNDLRVQIAREQQKKDIEKEIEKTEKKRASLIDKQVRKSETLGRPRSERKSKAGNKGYYTDGKGKWFVEK